jgi:hypothetical protein
MTPVKIRFFLDIGKIAHLGTENTVFKIILIEAA